MGGPPSRCRHGPTRHGRRGVGAMGQVTRPMWLSLSQGRPPARASLGMHQGRSHEHLSRPEDLRWVGA
eukprot:scaffold4200_cov361-Prasinococcus_capsulatus_cf.AAC.1